MLPPNSYVETEPPGDNTRRWGPLGGDEALRVEPPQWDRVLIKETARPSPPPRRRTEEKMPSVNREGSSPNTESAGTWTRCFQPQSRGAPCFLPSPVCGAGSAGAETREDPSRERIRTVTEVRRRQTYGGKQFARPEHSLF